VWGWVGFFVFGVVWGVWGVCGVVVGFWGGLLNGLIAPEEKKKRRREKRGNTFSGAIGGGGKAEKPSNVEYGNSEESGKDGGERLRRRTDSCE